MQFLLRLFEPRNIGRPRARPRYRPYEGLSASGQMLWMARQR